VPKKNKAKSKKNNQTETKNGRLKSPPGEGKTSLWVQNPPRKKEQGFRKYAPI